jgi:phosphoglycolate phosphatase
MKYEVVLFDFDGTLADSEQLSLDIMNALAPEFGYAPITPDEIPKLKRMSAWQLLDQRSGIPLWNFAKIRRLEKRVREEFQTRSKMIKLFPGISGLLRGLREAGYRIGVVSSNAENIVEHVLQGGGVKIDFIHAGSRFFGKARALRATLKEYSLHRSHVIYIGDELRDIDACRKVGVDMIAVGWGFNAPDALQSAGARVAATPEELLSILTTNP